MLKHGNYCTPKRLIALKQFISVAKQRISTALPRCAGTYFASAWSDQQDDGPDGVNLSGVGIFDYFRKRLPRMHSGQLATALCQCNGVDTLAAQYKRAASMPLQRKADRKLGPELVRHYLGMQGRGRALGLSHWGSIPPRDGLSEQRRS
jgi:hypothetical protein